MCNIKEHSEIFLFLNRSFYDELSYEIKKEIFNEKTNLLIYFFHV